jgi:hypothetical protein
MNSIWNNTIIAGIFILTLILLVSFQFILLIRIRRLLDHVSSYTENLSKLFFRAGTSSVKVLPQDTFPKTCQFCKYRLSYIHMGDKEGEVEDFYYKCRLRNIEITLNDSCDRYENEGHA